MGKIKHAKENFKVKIRCNPCFSLTASLLSQDQLNANCFFIRPEDLQYYEDYIDILDLSTFSQAREESLFDIYKRGYFYYELEKLIPYVHSKVLNPFIRDDFAPHRLNCGQRCQEPGRSCHLCDSQLKLTTMVVDYLERKREEKNADNRPTDSK